MSRKEATMKLSEQEMPEWVERLDDIQHNPTLNKKDAFLLGVQYAEEQAEKDQPKKPEVSNIDQSTEKDECGKGFASFYGDWNFSPVEKNRLFHAYCAGRNSNRSEDQPKCACKGGVPNIPCCPDPPEPPPLQSKERRASEIVRRLLVLFDIYNNLPGHDMSWVIGLYEKLGLGYEGDCGPTDEEFASQLSLCDKMHIERLYCLWVGNTYNRKGDNGQKED